MPAGLVHIFDIETEEYYSKCYNVDDAKTFKKFGVSSYALRSQIIRILAHLTRAFESHVNLVLCIVVSYSKDAKFYVLDPFHLQRTNKLSKLNQSMSRQGQPGL